MLTRCFNYPASACRVVITKSTVFVVDRIGLLDLGESDFCFSKEPITNSSQSVCSSCIFTGVFFLGFVFRSLKSSTCRFVTRENLEIWLLLIGSKGNGSTSHLYASTNLSTDNLASVVTNGDPIQVRRCSEPSLLADALENLSCSLHHHGHNDHNHQSPLNSVGTTCTTISSSMDSSQSNQSFNSGNGIVVSKPSVCTTILSNPVLVNSDNTTLHFDVTNKDTVKYNRNMSTMPININKQNSMQRSNDTLTNCDNLDSLFKNSVEHW